MNRLSLPADDALAITWLGNSLMDWKRGKLHHLSGEVENIFNAHSLMADAAVSSVDGRFALIFPRLGNRGLLLKDGKPHREIRRPDALDPPHEWPALFVELDGRTVLIHCPLDPARLDFEDAETGEILTSGPNRNPVGIYHSRLEASPNGRWLMSKGWVWHPWGSVNVFDIGESIKNPCLLDGHGISPVMETEPGTASFLNDSTILIGTTKEPFFNGEKGPGIPPSHIGLWQFESDTLLHCSQVKGEFGTLIAIDEHHAWDTFGHPKILNLHTGEIVDEETSIPSGSQQMAIIWHLDHLPTIIVHPSRRRLAIALMNRIEIVWPK